MTSLVILWLIIGLILCLMELLFPTAFVAFMMGLSAIIVASLALVITNVNFLIIIWMICSILLITLTKRFVKSKHKKSILRESEEAETLTTIDSGKAGRVLYEGNSWRAICEDETISIPPHEKVYIVSRKGNTLFVLPFQMLKY